MYVLDPGIRNATIDYLDESLIKDPAELGIVVESVLFDHLIRLKYDLEPGPTSEIFYWKEQKEIDFILTIKRKAIPIESKYRTRIRDDPKNSLMEFVEDKKCPFGIIITKDEFGLERNIIKAPLWIFLLMI